MAQTQKIPRKRRRGIYYTPDNVTELLCGWAIEDVEAEILEPSFGGCGFLTSSYQRLLALGSRNPDGQLYGCDIDPAAFKHLAEKMGPIDLTGKFILGDFLTLKPEDFQSKKFDVLIGNPPYVSNQNMYKSQLVTARKILAEDNSDIKGKLSLWAYFVLHGQRFLKSRAKIAWLLPSSLVNSFYGKDIVRLVSSQFDYTQIISCSQRLFLDSGAKESSIVLLAKRNNGENCRGEINGCHVGSIAELSEVIAGGMPSKTRAKSNVFSRDNYSASLGNSLYTKVANGDTNSLGDFLDVKIGLVTGRNSFFVLNKTEIEKNRIPKSYQREIYSKFSMCKGLNLSQQDLDQAVSAGKKCILISASSKKPRSKNLKRYLETISMSERLNVSTFRKREVWCQTDDGVYPDAFISYMNHTGPRLVLNTAYSTCTNSIHRVFFKLGITDIKKKLIAISLLSSFSQVSAEKCGRSYGSGVLKHEPSEIRKIKLVIPARKTARKVNHVFALIDEKLRKNELPSAMEIADEFILGHLTTRSEMLLLRDYLSELREARALRR